MSNVVSQVGIKPNIFNYFLASPCPLLFPLHSVVFLLYRLRQRLLYGNTYKQVFEGGWEVANKFTLLSNNPSFGGKETKIIYTLPSGREKKEEKK